MPEATLNQAGAESAAIKVAIASKHGISVDLHFGHADTFWVYTIENGETKFLEKREVDKYCHGHTGSTSAMQKILATINDCNAVFSAKIGDGPTEKLAKIGVIAISEYAYESIEDALFDYKATL